MNKIGLITLLLLLSCESKVDSKYYQHFTSELEVVVSEKIEKYRLQGLEHPEMTIASYYPRFNVTGHGALFEVFQFSKEDYKLFLSQVEKQETRDIVLRLDSSIGVEKDYLIDKRKNSDIVYSPDFLKKLCENHKYCLREESLDNKLFFHGKEKIYQSDKNEYYIWHGISIVDEDYKVIYWTIISDDL